MQTRKPYPTDLADGDWARLEPLVPTIKRGGRPARWSRREIVNGILYVVRTGSQWRALPHDLPRGRRCLATFTSGATPGFGRRSTRRCAKRCGARRGGSPRRAPGFWRVKRPRRVKEGPRGYDSGKPVKGRKRHLLVDTLGLLLKVVVSAANVSDAAGARLVAHALRWGEPALSRLAKPWADSAYAGTLEHSLRTGYRSNWAGRWRLWSASPAPVVSRCNHAGG